MRPLLVTFIMLSCLACDKDDKAKELELRVAGSATTTVTTSSAPLAPVDAAAAPTASIVMPERPIPKGQTMVGMGAPEEVQMRAITYMAAMRSPRPGDANADPAYAADLQKKLKPILLGLDKGPDKAKWNRIEVVANGREINLLMSQGCDPETPTRAVVNGAGIQLTTLVQNGVLVIKCNDTKVQCLQSTRDPEDVLCTTGIRHK
jgi:intracellular sulfur oxidation DsrE/DsrF family protein